MHVISVRLDYYLVSPNIIWLPWQRPLPNLEISTDPLSAPKVLSYGEKIAKIGSVYPEIFEQEMRLLYGAIIFPYFKNSYIC